jgi:hypothetical protein
MPPIDSPAMRRLRHLVLLGIAAALCSWLAGSAAGRPAAGTALAPLHLSPSGSDSRPCTKAAPCRSFDRAYRAAKPGQTVVLAAGRYGGQQEVPADRSKTSSRDVVFRPAAGGRVVVEALDVFGSHVQFRGLAIEEDFYVKCGADDVTLRGSKARQFFIRSATNIAIVGTEFGPSRTISQIGHTEECPRSPRGILLHRVYMHDFTNSDPGKHMECLTVQAANDLVIRRSRFYHCQDFDILFKHRAPVLTSTNVTLENNWFDVPWPDGSTAVQFSLPDSGGAFRNLLIRNNSFAGTLLLKDEVDYSNARVFANLGPRFSGPCRDADVAVAYNVWSDEACGARDRKGALGYRNAARFDFHLTPGAAAINRGHPQSFPGVDIDGQRRPRGNRPDAGADEAR